MRKKIYLFAVAIYLSINSLWAQAPLVKGEKQLNAGLGFSGWGLPVYAGLDFGVHKDITVGIEGSFRAYSDYSHSTSYSHTIVGILGTGNYHFNSLLFISSQWDFYAGLNLGFYIWSSSSGYDGPNSSGLGLGLQLGGRYFFTQKFGINLEFTGGNAILGGKIGITCIL
jgi:outer membrane immunogenic protein